MRLKCKNRWHIFDKNKLRSRNRHKYTKYEFCYSSMMVMCITQNFSNIWISIANIIQINTKVEQHWGWVEKRVAYKKACISTSMLIITLCFTQKSTIWFQKLKLPNKTGTIKYGIAVSFLLHKKEHFKNIRVGDLFLIRFPFLLLWWCCVHQESLHSKTFLALYWRIISNLRSVVEQQALELDEIF